jgi:hypothetical protein
MAKKSKPKGKKLPTKHAFYMESINLISGEKIITPRFVDVYIPPPGIIPIDLYIEHVELSVKLNGRGSSQSCPGTICTYKHKSLFAHPVSQMGIVDYTDRNCFIVSHDDGIAPTACYGYSHDQSWMPKMNDKKNGAALLKRKLEKAGGHIRITLTPMKFKKPYTRVRKSSGPSGKKRTEGHVIRIARSAAVQTGFES